MEAGPGQAGFFKESDSGIQDSRQIPGDEVQVSGVQSSGAAQQGKGILPGLIQQRGFQFVPEGEDRLSAVLAGEGVQRVDEKSPP